MIRLFAIRMSDLLEPEKRKLFEGVINDMERDAHAYDFIPSTQLLTGSDTAVAAMTFGKVDALRKVVLPVSEEQWEKAAKRSRAVL